MGYLHDITLTRFYPPEEAVFSAGAWTDVCSSHLWYRRRTAAAPAFRLRLPLKAWGQHQSGRGCQPIYISLWYEVSAAAALALDAQLYRLRLPEHGQPMPAPLSLPFTYSSGEDTTAKRVSIDQHKLNLYLSEDFWLTSSDQLWVELTVTPAAATVFDYYGARLEYELRI